MSVIANFLNTRIKSSERISVLNAGQFIFMFTNNLPTTTLEGPSCPSGYDAVLTNQTSLVRFPSPLTFF